MKLIEYQTISPNLFLVCEFFDGKEILEILDKYGNFSEQDAKTVIFNVMIGTSHIHSKNIIHRDLKLENILVHRVGNRIEKVKIIDLGLGTKIVGETSGFLGTPNYMPPEVYKKGT